MKSALVTSSSIVLAVVIFLLTGCKAREAGSDTAARSTPPPVSNANSPEKSPQPTPPAEVNRNGNAASKNAAPDSAKPKSPPQLAGTYESREVHSEGVVTVMSKLRTTWVFSTDGKYSRVSEVNGKPYHSDSGIFRIEGPDQLVLTIQVTGQKAKRKPQIPAVEKAHKFSLSSDGEELKLISTKGTVGVFRRIARPNAPS